MNSPPATTPTGTISGTLTNATDNSPVANASVYLSDSVGIKVTTTSDATGKYTLPPVVLGQYNIRAITIQTNGGWLQGDSAINLTIPTATVDLSLV
jgi:hypothetical protein